MPPRHTYWTIIVGSQPTAFRSATRDELLPTLKQLQSKHADAVMMWFARGRLWTSDHEAREALVRDRRPRRPEGSTDRPGGGPPNSRPQGRPQFRDRPREDRAPGPKPEWRDRPPHDRPRGPKPESRDRPPHDRPHAPKPEWRERAPHDRPRGPKPEWRDRPPHDRPRGPKPESRERAPHDRPRGPKPESRDRSPNDRTGQDRTGQGGERRGRDWRPGGEHRDPRARFKVPRDLKRARFAARLRRKTDKKKDTE